MDGNLKESDKNVLSSSGSQRITATLPSSTFNELETVANDDGISVSEAARRSIKRDLGLRKLEERGGELLVQFPDGRTVYIMPND